MIWTFIITYWPYIIALAFLGITINVVIFVLAQAATPGIRYKPTFWDYAAMAIPFSVIIGPLFCFLISPWRR